MEVSDNECGKKPSALMIFYILNIFIKERDYFYLKKRETPSNSETSGLKLIFRIFWLVNSPTVCRRKWWRMIMVAKWLLAKCLALIWALHAFYKSITTYILIFNMTNSWICHSFVYVQNHLLLQPILSVFKKCISDNWFRSKTVYHFNLLQSEHFLTQVLSAVICLWF